MQKLEEAQIYQRLKKDVESRFGSEIKYSKDCRFLSEQIFETTNRQISISTIKRVFGIISSSFRPSKYTLDTLAFYAGFEKWEVYLNQSKKNKSTDSGITESIHLITAYSLKSIRQKIRFDEKYFIPRNFANNHLESFLSSEKTATILVSPAGYGKSSILLQYFQNSSLSSGSKDDIVCLIDGGIFFSIYNIAESSSVLNQLIDFEVKECPGLFLQTGSEKRENRYIIIIDDVDEIYPRKDKYYNLVKNLMQIILMNKNNHLFKMILTCRPENLDPFISLIMQNPLLAKLWYHVNFFHQNHLEAINVPFFDKTEINSALSVSSNNLSYYLLSFYYPDLLLILNNPSFFATSRNIFASSDFSELKFMDNLVQQVIYSSPYSEDKQALVKTFFRLCNMAKEQDYVDKELLLNETECQLAYHELLATGIIYENFVTEYPMNVQIKVRFSNSLIFQHILFRLLFPEENPDIDFLKKILEDYDNNTGRKFEILKWVIKFAFAQKLYDLLKHIHLLLEQHTDSYGILKVESLSDDYLSVQNIFSLCFRNSDKPKDLLLSWMTESQLGRLFYYEELFDLDNLMNFPLQNLEFYSKNNPTPNGEVFTSYTRFIKSFYKSETEICYAEWQKIRKINLGEVTNPVAVSYYFSIQLIHSVLFKNETNPELLTNIILTSADLRKKGIQNGSSLPYFEFLVLYSLNTCNLFDDILSLSDYIDACYDDSKAGASCYWQYYRLCVARAFLHKDTPDKAIGLYRQVKLLPFPTCMRHFMQMNSDLIRAEFFIHMKKNKKASALLQDIKKLADFLGFQLFITKVNDLELKLKDKKIAPSPHLE